MKKILILMTLLFVGCTYINQQSQASPEDELWQKANANLADHRYNQALFDFKQFAQLYTASDKLAEAEYKIAYTNVILGNYREALSEFNDFIVTRKSSRWVFSAEVWRDVLDDIVNRDKEVRTETVYIEKDQSEIDQLLEECRAENRELRERIDKLEHIIEGEP